MRIPVLNIGGQFAPVVRYFIDVFPGTKPWFFAAGLIRSSKKKRRSQSGSDLSEKCAAGYKHSSYSSFLGAT
jgi:hypothetical protein